MKEQEQSITEQAIGWLDQGRNIALATVVRTWGSAPQPVGAQLLIDADGQFEGSVSGGCVEGAVITEAADLIGKGSCKLLSFGVADAKAWEVGLACGGKIDVFVESIDDVKAGLLKQIGELQAARKAVAKTVDLESGDWQLIEGAPQNGDVISDGFRFDKSGVIADRENTFLHIFNPSLRLVIIGAVHIAQSLAPLARLTGYDVTVIDPRGSFASVDRFKDVTLIAQWPDDVLKPDELDVRTAFVALTHDPKIDDPALKIALASDCFYIGALGSRKTHAARLDRLAGLDGLERIDGPIGLDIGGRGAAEIAVSIIAKMTSVLRKGE